MVPLEFWTVVDGVISIVYKRAVHEKNLLDLWMNTI